MMTVWSYENICVINLFHQKHFLRQNETTGFQLVVFSLAIKHL
jgi:hypothetical protein